VRLRSSASAYFNRTPASAGNRKTWTWSGWVKRAKLGTTTPLLEGTPATSQLTGFSITSGDVLAIQDYLTGSYNLVWATSAVYRDPSAWYHVVVSYDTTQASSSNTVKAYVNGVQQTVTFTAYSGSYSQNRDSFINATNAHFVNRNDALSSNNFGDYYLTEINFIDGQALTPSSFGKTDAATNQWIPKKFAGTYGTNGFYLKFADASAATAAAIGKDFSGNGNNWTPNNISVTAGVTYDSMTDVPTLTSATAANYCVLNPLNNIGTYATFSNGNLRVINTSATSHSQFAGTMGITSSTSKIYWEVTTQGDSATRTAAGIGSNIISGSNVAGFSAGQYTWYVGGGAAIYWEPAGGASPFSVSWATGDVLNFAYDPATGNLFAGKNGTYYSSTGAATGNPATGANPTAVLTNTNTQFPIGSVYNAGSNSYLDYNFGQQPFTYTPPTGYKSLNAFNI
jgi:hypothetical protein